MTRRAVSTGPAALPVPPADLVYVHHGRRYLEFGVRFAGYCRDLARPERSSRWDSQDVVVAVRAGGRVAA